jgi:hypothetical protein
MQSLLIIDRDGLFLQSVRNLKEYQESWDNYTEEEQEEADRLFIRYSHLLKGTMYELY